MAYSFALKRRFTALKLRKGIILLYAPVMPKAINWLKIKFTPPIKRHICKNRGGAKQELDGLWVQILGIARQLLYRLREFCTNFANNNKTAN